MSHLLLPTVSIYLESWCWAPTTFSSISRAFWSILPYRSGSVYLAQQRMTCYLMTASPCVANRLDNRVKTWPSSPTISCILSMASLRAPVYWLYVHSYQSKCTYKQSCNVPDLLLSLIVAASDPRHLDSGYYKRELGHIFSYRNTYCCKFDTDVICSSFASYIYT